MKKIEKVTDCDRPLILREEYLVPHIHVRQHGSWMPIVLPLHNDADFLNFPIDHYHYDIRFLYLREMRLIVGNSLVCMSMQAITAYIGSQVVGNDLGDCDLATIKFFKRKCRRQNFDWLLNYRGKIKRFADFEDYFCGIKARIAPCGKCPHKGVDLRQVLPDENGIKTCPAHGLRFDKQGDIYVENRIDSDSR